MMPFSLCHSIQEDKVEIQNFSIFGKLFVAKESSLGALGIFYDYAETLRLGWSPDIFSRNKSNLGRYRSVCDTEQQKSGNSFLSYSVLRIRITSMRIRLQILPFTLMRIRIRVLPFNLMRIRIRILPLTFFKIWTLQCSKMTLSGFHLFTLMRIRILLFTLMWIRIPLSTLMRIRIQLPKMIRIQIRNTGYLRED